MSLRKKTSSSNSIIENSLTRSRNTGSHHSSGKQASIKQDDTRIYQGYLKKKTPHGLAGLKPWRTRYFILTPSALLYYTTKDQVELTGSIPLVHLKEIHWHSDKKSGIRFDVCTSTRVYSLSAPSTKEAKEWVTAISDALQKIWKAAGEDSGVESSAGGSSTSAVSGNGLLQPDGAISGGSGHKGRHRRTKSASKSFSKDFEELVLNGVVDEVGISGFQKRLLELIESNKNGGDNASSDADVMEISAFTKKKKVSPDKSLIKLIKATKSSTDLAMYLLRFSHFKLHGMALDDLQNDEDNETKLDEDHEETTSGNEVVPIAQQFDDARDEFLELITRISLADWRNCIKEMFHCPDTLGPPYAIALYWAVLNIKWKREQHVCSTPWNCSRCSVFIQNYCSFVKESLFSTLTSSSSTASGQPLVITGPVVYYREVLHCILTQGFWEQGAQEPIPTKLLHPELLHIYLEIIQFCSKKMKRSSLMDINSLLIQSDVHISRIVEQSCWQQWIYPFMRDVSSSSSADEEGGKQEEELLSRTAAPRRLTEDGNYTLTASLARKNPEDNMKIHNLATNIVITGHHYLFMSADTFADAMKETLSSYYVQGSYTDEAYVITKRVMKSMLLRITNSRKYFGTSRKLHCWQNLLVLAEIMADFIFKTPFLGSFFKTRGSVPSEADVDAKFCSIRLIAASVSPASPTSSNSNTLSPSTLGDPSSPTANAASQIQCADADLVDLQSQLFATLHLGEHRQRSSTIEKLMDESEYEYLKQSMVYVSFFTDTAVFLQHLQSVAMIVSDPDLIKICTDWYGTLSQASSASEKRQKIIKGLSALASVGANGIDPSKQVSLSASFQALAAKTSSKYSTGAGSGTMKGNNELGTDAPRTPRKSFTIEISPARSSSPSVTQLISSLPRRKSTSKNSNTNTIEFDEKDLV